MGSCHMCTRINEILLFIKIRIVHIVTVTEGPTIIFPRRDAVDLSGGMSAPRISLPFSVPQISCVLGSMAINTVLRNPIATTDTDLVLKSYDTTVARCRSVSTQTLQEEPTAINSFVPSGDRRRVRVKWPEPVGNVVTISLVVALNVLAS